MIQIIFTLIVLSFSLSVSAQSTFKNLFYENSMTLEQRILGRSCYSLEASANSIDCNPALLAGDEKKQLKLDILSDESFNRAFDYYDMIRDDDVAGLISELHDSRNEPLYTKTSINLWYQNDWWALGYTPLRVGVVSKLRNPSLSEIATHLIAESELSFRAGLFVSEDTRLRVGMNLRYIESDFLQDHFLLVDAIADPDMVALEQYKRLYLEPAMVYDFDSAWKAQASVIITNLAIYDSGSEKHQDKAAAELGYATTPDIFGGRLTTTAHITTRAEAEEFQDYFLWGATYRVFKSDSLSFRIGGNSYAVGYLGRVDSLNFGIGYESEVLRLNGQSLERVSQASFELGLSF